MKWLMFDCHSCGGVGASAFSRGHTDTTSFVGLGVSIRSSTSICLY